LNVDGTYGYSVGDKVLLVSNTTPAVCTLEQITTLQPSAAKMQHNPGGTAPYNPPSGGPFPAYTKDSLVIDMGNPLVHTYQVANGNLQLADMMLIAGGGAPSDVADGIIDLRAQYGKDNGVNNGTVTNTTYAANDGVIDSFDNVAPVTAADWSQVLAVRVAVLSRIDNYEKPSVSGGNCDATTVMPTWSGSATDPFTAINVATLTSQDRCFRYRVFQTVIPLRNMIWRAS
ncbi:MAG TPA: PilW family protein, partial [Burkholderiales bacterium]|nr:PilW family protein [Burkholderiales bacterium]